jgi:NTE family protein
MVRKVSVKHKISLALGGGGFKGYAHIGVINQLQRAGFEINAIAGTSAGGVMGALFSFGYSPDEIGKFITQIDHRKLFNHLPGDSPSIMGLGGLYSLLERKLGDHTFDELKIPFACTAVDMKTGQEIIINSGRIVDAIEATTAIPGIFPSKVINSLFLVDGGVLDPVPVSLARWLSPNTPTIAICLSSKRDEWKNLPRFKVPSYVPLPGVLVDTVFQMRIGRAMRVFIESINLMSDWISELRLISDKPDFIVRPDIGQYSMFDEIDPDEAIALGEKAVKNNIDEIEKVFSANKQITRWLRPSPCPGILINDMPKVDTLSSLEKGEQYK